MTNYNHKYLKYKTKYLKLKGGSDGIDVDAMAKDPMIQEAYGHGWRRKEGAEFFTKRDIMVDLVRKGPSVKEKWEQVKSMRNDVEDYTMEGITKGMQGMLMPPPKRGAVPGTAKGDEGIEKMRQYYSAESDLRNSTNPTASSRAGKQSPATAKQKATNFVKREEALKKEQEALGREVIDGLLPVEPPYVIERNDPKNRQATDEEMDMVRGQNENQPGCVMM